MNSFFKRKRKGVGMLISALLTCVLVSMMAANVLQINSAAFVGQVAARIDSQARLVAESKMDLLKTVPYASLADEPKTAYGTSGFETEVVLGAEVDLGGGNKQRDLTVNVYRPTETIARFTLNQVRSLVGISGIPSGTIIPWYGNITLIPSGWVYCDGTNGTPDMRGKTVIGTGSVTDAFGTNTYDLGNVGGERMHQLTIMEMPSHNHQEYLPVYLNNNVNFGRLYTGTGVAFQAYETGYTGGNQAHNNMMPYVVIHWIMKL